MEAEKKQDWQNYGNSNVMKKDEAPALIKKSEKTHREKGNGALIALVIFSLLVGAGGVGVGVIALINSNKEKPATTVSVNGYYSGNSAEFEQSSVAEIASKVTPAVVSILSEVRTNNRYYGYSTSQASGTGMIVSADGYVMTNKHVIEGSKKLQVVTDSGDTYDDVDIVGTDPLNDVAYLKINGVSNLPTVTLGDSKTISVGQPVLAIGNALGAYQNTVTQGIVSGLGRSLTAYDSNGENGENLTDMIQTDAAINPGNSGGPLVNAAGDVIGINTAVTSSANGLGFAIPIAATKGMLRSIMENNKAERAYIGIRYVSVTPDVAKEFDLSVSHGAYIYSSERNSKSVIDGGPADKAGLEDGDVITKIGTVEVGRAGSITTLVGEYKPGETIEIEYVRNGETKTTNLTLAAYED